MSEHWTPNPRGMPQGGAVDAADRPERGTQIRAPRWVLDRFEAAARAAGYNSTNPWVLARLQEAADRDLEEPAVE